MEALRTWFGMYGHDLSNVFRLLDAFGMVKEVGGALQSVVDGFVVVKDDHGILVFPPDGSVPIAHRLPSGVDLWMVEADPFEEAFVNACRRVLRTRRAVVVSYPERRERHMFVDGFPMVVIGFRTVSGFLSVFGEVPHGDARCAAVHEHDREVPDFDLRDLHASCPDLPDIYDDVVSRDVEWYMDLLKGIELAVRNRTCREGALSA